MVQTVTGFDPGLEAGYNARAAVPDHPQILARWARDSAVLRQQLDGQLDLAYGDDAGERLDWFPASGPSPRPVVCFVHGGYWRTLDKADFTFVVPPLHRLGVDVVLFNYGLCPRVSVAEIVAQQRRALAWTHAHAARFGADPGQLHLVGHSAGGHLVAMLMATDWAAAGQPGVGAALRGGLALSGLYELEPLLRTSINVEARLDAATAAALSPARLTPTTDAPLLLAVGAEESDAFHWQSATLAAAWSTCAEPEEVPGAHHFSIVDGLATPGESPWRLLERLLTS